MKEYLVKSSSKVIGPFSEEELIDLLIHNQISLLDEIKKPYSRWIYLREDKHFREVIERVRQQIDQLKDDTEGATLTFTATKRVSDDLTPTPIGRHTPVIQSDAAEIQALKTKHSEALKEIKNATERNAQADLYRNHIEPLSPTPNPVQWKSFAIAALVVLLMGYLFFNRILHREEENPQSQFFKAMALKQNQMAMSSYQAMTTQERMNVKVQKMVLPLMANFDKGNLEVKDSLMQLLQSVDDKKEKSVFANSIGLSYLHEQNWNEATRYFEAAVKYDVNNPAPLINLATHKLLTGNPSLALEDYRRLLRSSMFTENGVFANTLYKSYLQFSFIHAFYKTYSPLDLQARQKGYAVYRADLESIGQGFEKQYFLSFEVNYFMFLIHLEFLQSAVEQQFRNLLRNTLSEGSHFYKSPDLFWEMADWKSMRDYCDQTSIKSLQVSLFKTLCYLRSNQETDAERNIKENILQFPKEKDAMLTYAVYLQKVGKYDEAKAQTDVILKSEPSHRLAQWVQSAICVEAARESCSAKVLREILKANYGNIASWVDLFRLDGEKVKYEFPLENLNAIDRQTYLPYIEVVIKDKAR
jgi:thioredoxin-like negative regulator of GroEL